MRDDVAWQAPLASIAAIVPGLVFLAIAVVGLVGASSSGCLNFVWGRMLFGVIIALLTIALGRALVKAARSATQVRRLICASVPADASIESIARRCGVRVRILSCAEPFCALADAWNPVVLVSLGSLERLDEEELEAALHHERAHDVRFDLFLGAALSFFVDLLPLPAGDLVKTYAASRESAADDHAVRKSAREVLASAIVSLATKQQMLRGAAALAEDVQTTRNRVMRLLENSAERIDPRRRRYVAILSLAGIAAVSFVPAVLTAFNYYSCTLKGMHG